MIVVIADDISGAAELAGAALRHGLTAEVQTRFDPDTDAEVVCVDTDTRSCAPAAAATTVGEFARAVTGARPTWIYKKCDSVLRGPVLAETRALMTVLGRTQAFVVPANPSRGRVIRDGVYFVAGQPLHQTFFARDPEYPRTTSRMTELLGGNLAGITAPDAQSTSEVAQHAGRVNDETLPVGGVDFFEALLRQRGHSRESALAPPPVDASGSALLVCGSAAAWTMRRHEARGCGVPVFPIPHDGPVVCATWRSARRALVGIGDGPATSGRTPTELAQILATGVVEMVRHIEMDRLLLEGGATAAAVIRALGWTRLQACEVSPAGMGIFTPAGAARPRVFIKPGSYPWPKEIWPGT